jgi:enamine deaminase RidA (YjgF/YER057c/UK114 family)
VADASRLVFFVSPLSAKGLLTAQVRDAVKSLLSQTRGAQIVKIRAFVAGSGDLRRVPSVVSELFTEKRLALPAVSAVQVGALPMTGAQVQLQAIGLDKKPVNPKGLAFVSGQAGNAAEAGARLTKALADHGLKPESVRQVTCFVDSLDFEGSVRQQMGIAFPKAISSYAQLRRDSAGDFSECEAVAALDSAPAASPTMAGSNERYSQMAMVGPVPIAFTGIQMAFGREEKDLKLALERFTRILEGVGANWKSVAFGHTYLMTGAVRDQFRAARLPLIDAKAPPASTMLVFEGLQSLEASLGLEAVAVVRK